jgi:inner membrane protein COX18
MNSLLRARLLCSQSTSVSSIARSLPHHHHHHVISNCIGSSSIGSLPVNVQKRHLSAEQVLINVHTTMINSEPVLAFQEALVNIHSYSGLPWAAEIVACGIVMRSALLPLVIYERKQQAKFENLSPQLQKHMSLVNEQLKVKMAKREVSREQAKKEFTIAARNKRKQLILDNNLHPFKRVIVILFQIPIWVTMSCALSNLCLRSPYIHEPKIRELATEAAPQLQTEGLLWFQDLTLSDPTYVLPVLFGTMFMANVVVTIILDLNASLLN